MNQGTLAQNTIAGEAQAAPWPRGAKGAQDAESASPWSKRFQQVIIAIHRWIGIAVCLMMLVWFISGVVLAYVRFPAMDATEKLQVLPSMEWGRVAVTPSEAIRAAGLTEMPKELRLEMSGKQPVYRIVDWNEKRLAVSAATGAPIGGVGPEDAVSIVGAQLNAPNATLKSANLDSDQWTITGYWNKERPFHLISLNDDAGSEYYVSVSTGEVVLDTTRFERGWNWLGAVPHWLYFEFVRHYSHEPVWTWTVYILAGAGIFVAVSGVYIGINRLRLRARYVNGRRTPFTGWMKWHHVTGIVGGFFLVVWITTGFLTMYPGGFLEQRGLEKSEYAAYADTMSADFPFQALPILAQQGEEASRVSFRWIAGEPIAVLEDGVSRPRMVDANTGSSISLTVDRIAEQARVLQPDADIIGAKYIETGDEYWHTGFYPKKTPMVRVKFNDSDGSWYHIDPETGLLTHILDNIGRIDRWTVVALHDLDFHWLLERRPLWDLVLFATIVPGMLIVLTALIISFRRLQRTGLLPVGGVASRRSAVQEGLSLGGAESTITGMGAETGQVVVAFASQTGTAELLANKTAESVRRAGFACVVRELGDIDLGVLRQASLTIFVIATTGNGDPPDRAISFQRRLMRQRVELDSVRFALLALGSYEYRRFCGFGRTLQTWLDRCGAKPLFRPVFVHDLAPESLSRWGHQLADFTGRIDDFTVNSAPYEPWVLRERRRLNPGSAGGEAWHLELEPKGATVSWQAGDIAQIAGGMRWSDFEPQDVLLREREFSVASIPSQGRVHLLVRKLVDSRGRPGVASGFLTGEIELGERIPMRIRSNPSFHPPTDDRPMILVGNGTGMAGLRGHLLRREELGHCRAWLIFGERNASTDSFYSEDVRRWLECGTLTEAEFAYSRDTATKRYVQHVLAERAQALLRWIEDGASVYVCGSAHGMGSAVNAQLVKIFGEDGFEDLIRAGRYRRDVY